jgi:hypothetical protein
VTKWQRHTRLDGRTAGSVAAISICATRCPVAVFGHGFSGAGTAGYSRDDSSRAIQLLADDFIVTDGLATTVLSLDAAASA